MNAKGFGYDMKDLTTKQQSHYQSKERVSASTLVFEEQFQ